MSLHKKNRRHVFTLLGIIAFLIVLVGVLTKGLMLDPSKVTSALLNKPAHDFKVAWLQGQDINSASSPDTLKLSDFKGHPVILNFWASWCVSCREEAAYFEEFWRRHRTDGLIVIGIAIQDTPDAAKEFARYFGKSYILGLDTDGKAGIDYGVYGVPETFLIDRQGIIRHKEAGPMSLKMLEENLPKIL